MSSLIFERSVPGRRGVTIPGAGIPERALGDLLGDDLLRSVPPELPEQSELEVVRHYTRLSQLNFSIDTGFYPLGSCT
ncbi:MAG: aminomethyl-transferring glycine dehydrogenase subunit GcvPB, partial [Cyanobacteria bacterium REEB65]|nr:aminomethyl-transferring glycine dehydrogenase subunit GcvPB [Cyanobacteria bacterium REEB65]